MLRCVANGLAARESFRVLHNAEFFAECEDLGKSFNK